MESAISTSLFGADTEPTTLLGTTIDAFLVAALPEEGFKLLALWLILRKNPYFDEHFDGIVGTFLLIYFCIKLHRYARARIMEQIGRDERQRYL